MKMTDIFAPTLKEVPVSAVLKSHILMLRSGMIRKLASGIYTFMPLGFRVLKKIENIVREEMDRQGAQELLMPIVHPAELWQETGRWDLYGSEMFRLKDRHGHMFGLGPTHEEIITDLVRNEVKSYKQLPLTLYQIQIKFRDEIRPRFGVMRAREFMMKDAYSFDADEAGMKKSFDKMFEAYMRIFKRCGLDFAVVDADPGAIGGSSSKEFMVLAESGEEGIFSCPSCGYSINIDLAECVAPKDKPEGSGKPLEKVVTKGMKTVAEVASFLKTAESVLVKTLIYETDLGFFGILLRGDCQLNETKLSKLTGAAWLKLAQDKDIRDITGAAPGFSGPVGLKKEIKMIADHSVLAVSAGVCGANEDDCHYINLDLSRDVPGLTFADLRMITPEDACPKCGGKAVLKRGIEVGHVFMLGTKYSDAMKAKCLNSSGVPVPLVMGCYGIGVSRIIAAAIEQNNDDNGIIWPMAIAPYHAVIVPVNVKDALQKEKAEELYAFLSEKGIEIILDDRDERPGIKFKDADLMGIPYKITFGNRLAKDGVIEMKSRRTGESVEIPAAEMKEKVYELLQAAIRDRG